MQGVLYSGNDVAQYRQMILIEDSNTGMNNSDIYRLSEAQIAAIQKLVR